MTDTILRGVWLSEFPLDLNEGAGGNQLLQIDLPEDVAAEQEVIEEEKPHREFLVPAEVLNRHGPPRLVSPEDDIIDPRFKLPPDFR